MPPSKCGHVFAPGNGCPVCRRERAKRYWKDRGAALRRRSLERVAFVDDSTERRASARAALAASNATAIDTYRAERERLTSRWLSVLAEARAELEDWFAWHPRASRRYGRRA
jgi:hypothetical protein